MPEAVIVDAVRTPIGRALKGSLRAVRADDLAAIPLKALIERNPQLDFAAIGDVMMGCGSGEGEQGYNVGRNALLLAGIDDRVPGCTVNRFCASSLQTLRMAFHAIKPPARASSTSPPASSPCRAPGSARRRTSSLHPLLDGSRARSATSTSRWG
jgi:acetyl-CoA C-acetyltransferase